MVTSNNSDSYINCDHAWYIMLVDDLKDWILEDPDRPIYIQVGYNRFPIAGIWKYDDHILIEAAIDADNPVETKIPNNVA